MIIGDGIMLGVGGETASIFVTGLSETDSVSATHKILKKVPNPASVVPDGYTQLEYIESAGTQYIDTGISVPHESLKVAVQFSTSNTTQDAPISGYAYSTWGWSTNMLFVNNNQKFGVNGVVGPTVVAGTVYEVEYSNTYFKINGATTSAAFTGYVDGYNNTVFYGNGKRGQYKLYFYKLYNGSLLVRDYVPAKRNSDGLVGLYDLVSNTFFGNSGTGTFVAGAEIPQYIDEYVNGKTIIGKWTQIPNPAIVVPDGYTQLEYLQSTGTQYIVTGLNSTTRYDHEITFSDYTYTAKAGILGSSNYYYSYTGHNNTLRWCMSDRCYDTPGSLISKRTVKLGYNYLTVDGSSVSQQSDTNSAPSDTTHTLFKGYNCASVKIYSYRASLDGQLLRDFVPCKRNSDGELGMYDLVNNAFYTNAGTGTFTAGAEVPQTIDGFLIDKIKEYGTWTVTATDGTKTANVLINAATEFEVAL